MLTTRCTICGKEFSDEDLVQALCCPSCGTKSLPCDISDDVNVKINWHELRILIIWAENWARHIDEKEKEKIDKDQFNLLYTVMVIAERIKSQYPDKIPITLFSEIRKLKEEFAKDHPGTVVISDLDDESKLNL